jgi:RHS repeat-associated protein
MKPYRLLLLTCLGVLAVTSRADVPDDGLDPDPAWSNARRTNAISTASNITSSISLDTSTPAIYADNSGSQSVAEAATPDIQALARGLENDPVRIFNYVHDHIRYVLYFGSKKGAELTLLEKSGNDFDQSALLVALLRAAGYTNAAYQFGFQGVPYNATDGTHNDLCHWLGITQPNTNWLSTSNYLDDLFYNVRGYPAYFANYANILVFQRVWVTLSLGGTNYYLDPSFKVSEPSTGINLASAMGLSTNTLSSAAAGTDGGYYVSGLNEAAIRGTLTGYTTNLLDYIQSSYPNATVQQILSGRYIVPSSATTLPTTLLFTNYGWNSPPYTVDNVTNWANIPTNLMSSVDVDFCSQTMHRLIPQLAGERLTLQFLTNGTAQLWEDDNLSRQDSTIGTGRTNVILAVHHPVGSWNWTNNTLIPDGSFDVSMTNSYQCTNAIYALTYAFDPDWGWLQAREDKLDAYRQQGLSNTSRQVMSETLNIMGLTWMLQTDRAGQALAAQLGVLQQAHHRLGRMAQEAGRGYYVDVYNQLAGFCQTDGRDAAGFDRQARDFDLFTYFGSALEHGIIEQLQTSNLVAASTVKMLQIASTNSQAVYLATANNWASNQNIQSLLVNYPASTLSRISAYLGQGYYVLLPQNGSNHVAGSGSWGGYGYVTHLNSGWEVTGFSISGGYQGGYVSDPTAFPNTFYVATTMQAQPPFFTPTPAFAPSVTAADPVDMANGTFQLETTDLALGQAEPRGITLTRYYNSRRRNSNPAGMAGGWLHNYSVSAVESSAPQAGLGTTTPAQMAPMLVATCAAVGLYNDLAPDPKNWLMTALISKWGVDQMSRNGVSILMGQDTLQFIKQPDGTFTPPANCTWTLSKGSTYSLQQRHGNKFAFDSFGRLTNIVDQYNQSLTVSYNSSNCVQTVTDWKGRYLNFNYSGTPQRLTSVSDSAGRSVGYGYSTAYSSQGDLASVTDPEGKSSSYSYDTNHQIIATFDALSRLIVSNIYDSAFHVATQFTQGDITKMWQVYWSGWQSVEKDPTGSQRVFTYDDKSRPISVLDQLGNLSLTFYDGQDHVVMTVSPLDETNTFVYDGNHNLLFKIDPLGYTNGNVFDIQNNLVSSVDPLGHTTSFGYNGQFSLTGSTNGAGTWLTYAYNSDGTLYSKTDSAGTTTFGYDSYGQRNSITYPSSLGGESFQNTSLGDVSTHTSARSFITSFYYNNRRELTNAVAPANLTTSAAYDAADNLQSKTDARGFTTTSFWSPTRHLTGTVLPATAQGTPATTNLYDSRDWLMTSRDPLQQTTQFGNDVAGRLVTTQDPLSRTTQVGYDADGRKTSSTNAALEVTQQFWDGRGEMIRLADPAGNTVGYAFDAAGNKAFLTNRNGKLWQFQYDRANRLTNTISPLLRSIKQAYNDRGLLQSVTQASGRTATFTYDAKARKTTRADLIGTTTYQYDADNNLTNVFENGMTNSWTYDAYNRVTSYRDPNGYLIQYGWDASGNLTNLIYPGGRAVAYSYDSLNRLTNVTDWLSRQTTFTYDLANRLTSIVRPNSTVRQINFDADGETTNIVEKTSANFPIAFFTLGWTNSGRLAWEFGAPLPPNISVPPRLMSYDDDNKMTSFYGMTVSYDLDGNMTNGPLTSNTLTPYVYNARNQLVSAGGLGYRYDPLGNRIALTNGASVTSFVVNPNAKLPQLLMRITGGTTNYYVYGGGNLLYQTTETATSATTLTYHFDLRGSTIAITDANGYPVLQVQYSPYGLLVGATGTIALTDIPFLFNGRFGVMTDPNGLMYMRARYYNPYICRFVNPDPSGFAGGLNWYCFADGNPISEVDPFGLYGNPVSGPSGPVGPSSPWASGGGYYPNGAFYVPSPLPPPGPAAYLAGGVVVGVAGAAAATFAAPVTVAGLVAFGVPTATATATVTTTLGVAGAVGAGVTVENAFYNGANGNWNNVAFDVGTLGGGALFGGLGGGRFIADNVSPTPSTVPPSWNPITADRGYGFIRNPDLPYLTDRWNWLGTGPTPSSGGEAAMGISSGAGLFLQSSGATTSSTGK